MFPKLVLFCLWLAFYNVAIAEKMGPVLIQQYLDAEPVHLQIRAPEVWVPEVADETVFEPNLPYRGVFRRQSTCSENRLYLKVGETGTVKSPNYPRYYSGNLACEWTLRGPPGSRIQLVFFDVFTQPYYFAYFDYVMVSKNGKFTAVDRLSGDLNARTPMVYMSDENVIAIRLRTSAILNYRGFKAQYLVLPGPPDTVRVDESRPVPFLNRPVFDGVCGQPAIPSHPSTVPPPEDEDEKARQRPAAEIVRIPTDDERIFNGSEALKYAYPWMAALLFDGQKFCGGSLIDEQHILTAAHCTHRAKEVTVLLGAHNIIPPSKEDGRIIHKVTRTNIFQHPEYNQYEMLDDISIIRLPEKVQFTDRIRPVCLPNRNSLGELYSDQKVVVTGWGKLLDNATGISPVLHEAEVKVMPNAGCRQLYRGIVSGNAMCITPYKSSSPCKGDSGGPLVLRTESKYGPYYTQLGIVSFSATTCERSLPIGFTRITAFLDFINQVTGKDL